MMTNSANSDGIHNRGSGVSPDQQSDPWNIKRLLEWIRADFENRHLQNARQQAEYILEHALEIDRLHLYLNFDMPVDETQRARIRDFVSRRRRGEPIQYITGKSVFRQLELSIAPGVHIPRPETEILIDIFHAVIPTIQDLHRDEELRILELGTGSGNIAISIASEYPDCRIWATENYSPALEVAARNIERHSFSDRIQLNQGDWFQALENVREKFHVIISNPPYIPSDQIASLPREIKDFEPRQALDGGENGLRFYPLIFQAGYTFLEPGGIIMVECSETHTDQLVQMAEKLNLYRNVEKRQDLTRRDRFVLAFS